MTITVNTPRFLKNLKGSTKLLILAFFVTLGLGFGLGQYSAQHQPDSATMSVLKYAENSGAKGCRAEWHTAESLGQTSGTVYDNGGTYEVVCNKPVQVTNLDENHDPQR
jgi:hypothetical protein